MPNTTSATAIGLLSGGLDSTLAVKLLLDQGIHVIAFNMITPFCTCTRKGCSHEASCVANRFGVPIKVVYAGQEYIDMVKHPEHGYGSNMNPCLDCRILLFRKAKEYMLECGASFVFTGEVLGQRPMSQHRRAMVLIDREAGLEGRVVRPLCARHLPPTLSEQQGMVDRDKLLAFEGRRRIPQFELAKKLSITDYPCPAGGCRLTDPNYAKKLKESFEHSEDTIYDITYLRYGRHFRLPSGAKVIIGRNEEDNKSLQQHRTKGETMIEVIGTGSPICILKKQTCDDDLKLAVQLCLRYSDAKEYSHLHVTIATEDEPVKEHPLGKFLAGKDSIAVAKLIS